MPATVVRYRSMWPHAGFAHDYGRQRRRAFRDVLSTEAKSKRRRPASGYACSIMSQPDLGSATSCLWIVALRGSDATRFDLYFQAFLWLEGWLAKSTSGGDGSQPIGKEGA